MVLWKLAMAALYGETWKEKLLELESQEDDDEEVDSQPDSSKLDIFRQPGSGEEHDARRLRAGKILLAQSPEQLVERDKVLIGVLADLEGKGEREARTALKR